MIHKMKKIARKPLLWILLVAIAILAAIVFLYRYGFRITYAPNLETSWNAVSAGAGVVSAIAALGAVAVAVIVALKQNELSSEQNRLATMQNTITESQNNIADQQREIMAQQNAIALFDKRYELYNTLFRCLALSWELKKISSEQFPRIFVATFEDSCPDDSAEIGRKVYDVGISVFHKLHQGIFLFPFNTNDHLIPLAQSLQALVRLENIEMYDAAVQQYCLQAEQTWETLYPRMEQLLTSINSH